MPDKPDLPAATPKRRPGRPRLQGPSPEYVARLERIVAAAASVFREKGYDRGSLDDVAAAVGMRKAALYYYVRSKSDLLRLIFDRGLARGLEQLREIQRIQDPGSRLAAVIRHQVMLVVEDIDYFAVFFDHRWAEGVPGGRVAPIDDPDLRAREREYFSVFVDTVAAAVAAGVIPAVDPRYGAQAILGMTTWVYKWFRPGRDDPDAIVDAFVRLILRSSAPPHGKEAP